MRKNSKRALVVATVAGFFVHMQTMRDTLKKMGYVVDVAANFNVPTTADFSGYETRYDVCFSRAPFAVDNLRAYKQLRKLLGDGKYDLVICNTPVGGVLGRIAANVERRQGTRVVYMAHGFHFYKGAPRINWLVYYPVEWLCSWMTDILLTITHEDYERARTNLHAQHTYYIPGVGVDLANFNKSDGVSVREMMGIPEDCPIAISVGELNQNKNHQVMVRALAGLSGVHYVIAGAGEQMKPLAILAQELGVDERLHLLGQRDDVPRLLAASDVFVLPSHREGLNVSLMEAMATGLPCVCRKIRGNVDLVDDGTGGVLVEEDSPEIWASSVQRALTMDHTAVAEYNKSKVRGFSRAVVAEALEKAISA